MDKNAIKKYAVWARRELIERVSQRAMIYGITAKDTGDPNAESINGHLLSQKEKRQRRALITNIKAKGYEQVMEEVAYTWFNRFAALRFMEVNGYLPSHIRVFTNDAGEFKPQILAEAIHLELDGLDMNKVYELESANKSEELFKYLLIVQCNALNAILPGMFQKIDDYTELLLPDYLLREGSVIEQMVAQIPEKDWIDQVQIIGWLYQYYIAEPKDLLINAHKQYKSGDVPFVTQLFTSEWIVHFMVENSLGRLWLEGHPNCSLKTNWKYYLDEDEQDHAVLDQQKDIQREYAALKPEELLVYDPCCGSGHILCVMFDTLVSIYEDYGFTAREAAAKIVENNLWGLDIDERAVQLSYFAVMMKARQYDRRFLGKNIQPNVYLIRDAKITTDQINLFGGSLNAADRKKAAEQLNVLLNEMQNASEFGSLIKITPCDWDLLYEYIKVNDQLGQMSFSDQDIEEVADYLFGLIKVGQAISQHYHVIVTNPPYMNSSYMPQKLKSYVQKEYTPFKNDLFSAFACKVINSTRENGHIGLLMPYVWMFIASYEKMRDFVYRETQITSLVQLEYNAFEAACVPVATLTLQKSRTQRAGEYIQLSSFKGVESQGPKTLEAAQNKYCGYRYTANQEDFKKIPGAPVAYWVPKGFYALFDNSRISDFGDAVEGIKTGDNDRFLRLWFEVDYSKVSLLSNYNAGKHKWCFTTKGGNFRRWYGNIDYVMNWENDGEVIKAFNGSSFYKEKYLNKAAATWTYMTSGKVSFRNLGRGFLYNNKGPAVFTEDDETAILITAFMNTVVGGFIQNFLNPTLTILPGNIRSIPFIIPQKKRDRIIELAKECIALSKADWDSSEYSFNFSKHPLIPQPIEIGQPIKIKDRFEEWDRICKNRFQHLRRNEEELNAIFIETYGLTGELFPTIEEKDITVRLADYETDIKSLISYAVGCMFGRYSLDRQGLVCAGSTWKEDDYKTFMADQDAIIPICEDEYFRDDIVNRFVKFIEIVYGKETLEENLVYIANALGGKGEARKTIRKYFLNDFYTDHCDAYSVIGSGKRPIYWQFDSGKRNGFKCLIYVHRYKPDTIARIRTDYVHEQQSRYRTAIADLEQRINVASTSERVKLTKQLSVLKAQSDEIRIYEEKIHHLADQMIPISLDDGIKHNYELFGDVLSKIK